MPQLLRRSLRQRRLRADHLIPANGCAEPSRADGAVSTGVLCFCFVSLRVSMPAFIYVLVFDPKLNKLRYGSALLIYALILVLGSIPGARAEIGHYATGLVLHSLAYAALTLLVYTGSSGNPGQRAFKSVLTVSLMGACDELLQTLFSYRGASVSDWLVDFSSSILVSALLWALWPKTALAR